MERQNVPMQSAWLPDSEQGPLVSIVIPAYKPTYFEQALASACAQTYRPLEIIVGDDSRQDVIKTLVARYQQLADVPIHYRHNVPSRGELLNAVDGVRAARGKYIKFLHDDDVLMPDCVARLVESMERDPGIALASSRRTLIDEKGNALGPALAFASPFVMDVLIDGPQMASFLADHVINFIGEPSCVLCRRDDLLQIGEQLMSLNQQIMYGLGDLALYVQLMQLGHLVLLAEPLSCYRLSSERTSELMRDDERYGAAAIQRFTAAMRALGWCRPAQHNLTVDVRVLAGGAAFEPVDLFQAFSACFAREQSAAQAMQWIEARQPSASQMRSLQTYFAGVTQAPRIGLLVLDAEGRPQALEQTLASVADGQCFYPALSVVVLTAEPVAAQLEVILRTGGFEWVMLARAGDCFTRAGLNALGLELLASPPCHAIYGDAGYARSSVEKGVLLRPDFDLDYLLACPALMCRHWLFNCASLREVGGWGAVEAAVLEFDAALRLVEQFGLGSFGHLAEPWVITGQGVHNDSDAERALIASHLQRRGYQQAIVHTPVEGRHLIDYPHGQQPLVSIVLVVNDSLEQLQACLMSLLTNTRYPFYELLLVDNAGSDAHIQQWLQAMSQMGAARIRVLHLDVRVSHARACNLGAQQAQGEYLLLLRAQVLTLNADWLEQLLNHALRQEVGVVGAKALDAQGRVTHAGLVPAIEAAGGHVFCGQSGDSPGYMNRLQVDQGYLAVADLCLMVRKALFDQVGGLDDGLFEAQGADIDLCLRIGQLGYLTVWAARALVRFEPAAEALAASVQDALLQQWRPLMARDPYYSSSLSLDVAGGFSLAPAALCRQQPACHVLPVLLACVGEAPDAQLSHLSQALTQAERASCVQVGSLLTVCELERLAPQLVVVARAPDTALIDFLERTRRHSQALVCYYLSEAVLSAVRAAGSQALLDQALTRVDRVLVSDLEARALFGGRHARVLLVPAGVDESSLSDWASVLFAG